MAHKAAADKTSQAQKDNCYMILFICEIKINKLEEKEIGFVVTRGGG